MNLEQKIEITINKTILIIGSIKHIEIDEAIISSVGFVALDKVKTIACAGLYAYYETRFIDRLIYAKPDKGEG